MLVNQDYQLLYKQQPIYNIYIIYIEKYIYYIYINNYLLDNDMVID
jgi:hypothetical protein